MKLKLNFLGYLKRERKVIVKKGYLGYINKIDINWYGINKKNKLFESG